MSHRAKLLEEIRGLLSKADDEILEETTKLLRRAVSPEVFPGWFVGLTDLQVFCREKFGALDERETTELWLFLLKVDEMDVRYEVSLVRRAGRDEDVQIAAATAGIWRVSVESLQAFARTLIRLGGESVPKKPPALSGFQKTLLLAWASSL